MDGPLAYVIDILTTVESQLTSEISFSVETASNLPDISLNNNDASMTSCTKVKNIPL